MRPLPAHSSCSGYSGLRHDAPSADCIATLVPAEAATVLPSGSAAPQGCAAAVVDDATTAYLSIRGALDPAKELAKLRSQQARPWP